MRNHTITTSFILLGLRDDPGLQVLFFVMLFFIYILRIKGNLTIIIITLSDSHLNTLTCFFLRNFSFLEISFTTVCIPRFLYRISTGVNTLTYNACASQMFFVGLSGATEFFLLAAMFYDHYVAIRKPLHYMTIMDNKVCAILVFCYWAFGLLINITPLTMVLQLEFCDSNTIDHFFCDVSPIFKTSCTDTWILEQTVIAWAVLTFIIILIAVILSYVYIIQTILRYPSAHQKKKAFSTYSSHMIVFSIMYGSCIFIYLTPSAKEQVDINKGVYMLSTSVVPLLNQFIYTLRNKQVKQALNDTIKTYVSLTQIRTC